MIFVGRFVGFRTRLRHNSLQYFIFVGHISFAAKTSLQELHDLTWDNRRHRYAPPTTSAASPAANLA